MACFILIAGAMHSAWSWDRLVPLLEAAGHRVIAPDLPGMGEDRSVSTADVTLAMWGDFLADLVRGVGEPVILAGHSRGGLVIGEAAERVPELLAGLVYVTALIVPPGRTALQAMGVETSSQTPALSEDGSAFLLTPEQAIPLFYNRCTPEDALWAASRLSYEPRAPIETIATVTEARWGTVPRAFIECLDDRTLDMARQSKIQAAAPCDPVVRIDADHSPFLSAPETLAEALGDIARRFAAG